MTELMHLMDAVANQGRGRDGRKWQHPSDLSRRYADNVGGEGQIGRCVGGNGKQQNHIKQRVDNYRNVDFIIMELLKWSNLLTEPIH